MTRNTNQKKRLLCTAISLALLPFGGNAIAQQDEVEEVVVTGTFIRRSEGFTQASSVTQLSADDLADEGTLNLGEVIQNLSFVGGPSSSITNTIQGTSSRSTTIDLRGLGASSTSWCPPSPFNASTSWRTAPPRFTATRPWPVW